MATESTSPHSNGALGHYTQDIRVGHRSEMGDVITTDRTGESAMSPLCVLVSNPGENGDTMVAFKGGHQTSDTDSKYITKGTDVDIAVFNANRDSNTTGTFRQFKGTMSIVLEDDAGTATFTGFDPTNHRNLYLFGSLHTMFGVRRELAPDGSPSFRKFAIFHPAAGHLESCSTFTATLQEPLTSG